MAAFQTTWVKWPVPDCSAAMEKLNWLTSSYHACTTSSGYGGRPPVRPGAGPYEKARPVDSPQPGGWGSHTQFQAILLWGGGASTTSNVLGDHRHHRQRSMEGTRRLVARVGRVSCQLLSFVFAVAKNLLFGAKDEASLTQWSVEWVTIRKDRRKEGRGSS